MSDHSPPVPAEGRRTPPAAVIPCDGSSRRTGTGTPPAAGAAPAPAEEAPVDPRGTTWTRSRQAGVEIHVRTARLYAQPRRPRCAPATLWAGCRTPRLVRTPTDPTAAAPAAAATGAPPRHLRPARRHPSRRASSAGSAPAARRHRRDPLGHQAQLDPGRAGPAERPLIRPASAAVDIPSQRARQASPRPRPLRRKHHRPSTCSTGSAKAAARCLAHRTHGSGCPRRARPATPGSRAAYAQRVVQRWSRSCPRR